MGASNKYTADEQLEQIAFYWINLHGGTPAPLTVRILSRDRDMYLDLGGGNRIPKISERQRPHGGGAARRRRRRGPRAAAARRQPRPAATCSRPC